MNAAVLLIKTPDQKDLVAKITTFVVERGFNILDCQEHADLEFKTLFIRLKLDLEPCALELIGRDIERIVLARAVKAHLEHRNIVSGRRAIVFSSGA